jgi:hypothetical protein
LESASAPAGDVAVAEPELLAPAEVEDIARRVAREELQSH